MARERQTEKVSMSLPMDDNGTIAESEIPLVIGVLSDLAGDTAQSPLEERTFTGIANREELNRFMAVLKPTLKVDVPYQPGGEEKRPVTLKFESLTSFGPASLADADEYIRALDLLRRKLRDVLEEVVQGNKKLGQTWLEAIKDRTKMEQLLTALIKEDA